MALLAEVDEELWLVSSGEMSWPYYGKELTMGEDISTEEHPEDGDENPGKPNHEL